MYKFATAIGIDIGRTMIRTAIVRLDGKVFVNFEYPYDGQPDRNKLLSNITEAIKSTRARSVDHNVNPLCVGISAKGFIDQTKGLIIGPDQGIEGWTNISLSELLNKEVGLPVYVDNDANLMALAETSYGTASGFGNMVFVTLRSGIGGAIIIDGKLYRGVSNAAGEFGQMSLDYNGPISKTGVHGSFEQLASSVSLVRSYLSRIAGKPKEKIKIPDGFRAKDVFELSYKGDKDAIDAVVENAEYIGTGLANIISVFSPEIIVLGGGMAMAEGAYLDIIRENACKGSMAYINKEVKIERASLGYSATLMGASLYALTRLDGKSI